MKYENNDYERIIRICERYPNDENMLILKARTLKRLDKTYKFLECIEKVLKINPHNRQALLEMARYLKEAKHA